MSIKLSNIYHTYSKGTPFERLALNDVSLEISKGEIVAIIGHTGSGKSTLVQHLNGLLKPDKGSASIDGIDITAKGAEAKTARQQVGMVFQYPSISCLRKLFLRISPSVRVIKALPRMR